jgi:endonuclease/exonuclease/phosphatase family metal-dependent hydrolase
MLAAFAVPAAAQSVSLPAADTTLRGGAYDDMNFGTRDLETKSSTDPSYVRRAILKFDTHTTIPAGSPINSATLTLTVKSGSVSGRHLAVYCVPLGFDEFATTWRFRKGTSYWTTPGGDVNHQHGVVTVTNAPGSKINIDVTAITREAMQTSSRYTRVLLVDIDGTAAASYMAYYSNEASSELRPKLFVNYGTATNPVPPPPQEPVLGPAPAPAPAPEPMEPAPSPPPTGSTLRVLQWNIAQGWGTDSKPNIDRVVDWVITMNADVISFNEIMHYESYSADHVRLIADKLKARTGQNWSYKWVQKGGGSSGEGEAVMSRLPFAATASNLLPYNRSAAEAMVIVNGRPVNIVSTHLDAYNSSYRFAEIADLKPWFAGFAQQRIIMGDFNTWPGTGEIGEMTKDYRDGWAQAVNNGTAVTYADNPNGNTRRSRIDYVFYSSGATSLVLKKAQVWDTRDSRGYRPSDHNPLVATFEVR